MYAPYAAAGPRRRPAAVTISGVLMYVVAALAVVSAVLPLTQIELVRQTVLDTTNSSNNTMSPSEASTVVTVTLVVVAVIYALVAGGFITLAALTMRGRRAARVVTWVLAGLGSLCCCLGAVGGGAQMNLTTTSAGSSFSQSVDYPTWYRASSVGIEVLGLLCLLVVIVLLAIPASNEYFRKPADMMAVPPYPGYAPGYPAAYPPAYPPAPTYPAVPTYPSADPYQQQAPYQPPAAPVQPPAAPPMAEPTEPPAPPAAYPPGPPPSEPPTEAPPTALS